MDYIIIFLVLFPCYSLAQVQVTVFVCQFDSHVLNCSEGNITISTAVYGRTQSTVCGTSSTTDCERDVTDELVESCDGQMQCTVTASNEIFGNPCQGVWKYLEITYSCGDGLAHTAEITYPNYASDYPNNVDILWRVVVEAGYRVRIHFTDFRTQQLYFFNNRLFGDSVRIYHGATQSFDDVTRRARFSGDTVPSNVTSVSSFMWIRFTSDYSIRYRGFSVLAYAVTPNWACNFYDGNCELIIDEGRWTTGDESNYYYTEATWDSPYTANFIIPYEYTSSNGTLSFARYQPNDGYLSVTVCISKQRIDYSTTDRVVYEYISYSCEGINDVEITFTAVGENSNTRIRVLDIQLFEASAPSTASIAPATTSTHSTTSTKSTTTPSTQSSRSNIPASTPDVHTSDDSALSSVVIPAVTSVIVLLLIGLIIVAVFVYLRRRSREPKPVGPVDQGDDDPSLYNNPVYVSKEDDFSTPDLLVGINFRNGSSVSPAPNGSPEVENQYEDFDGDQKNTVKGCPLPTNSSSSRAGPLHSSPEAPDVDLVNTNMHHILERPESEVIYKEGDHTYEQAQGPAQSSRNPNEKANGHKGTDDVYENSSFASPVGGLPQGHVNDGGENGSSDVIAVLDDDEEYNALTFNQSSDITRALKKPKMAADHVNDGYGALDLPQDKAASLSTNSAELHNDDVYNSLDEPLVGQQNGKLSTKGERSNGKGDVDFQQGAESDYHNYKDPTQMDQEGSGPRSSDLDVFSNDQYNILDSGKQVGDYHVYQSTNDNDGDYTELDTSNMGGEDEYSTIALDQSHQPKAPGVDSFEPIYSEEVYSEFT